MLRLALALPLLALACTPDKSDSVTDTTTDPSTTDSPTTDSPTTDSPTSTTGSTTDQSTSTTGSTTDQPTGEPGTTGEPVCAPGPAAGDFECAPPGGTLASWEFLLDGNFTDEAYDEFCTIDDVTDDGATQTFALTCAVDSVTLKLTSTAPHVALALDNTDSVQIEFLPTFDGEVVASAFMLRDDTDALLAAGLDRYVTLPITLDPLNIGLRTTDCDGFIDEFGCFVIQRAAVEVALGNESAAVLGGNAGAVGEFQILVNDSTSNVCFFDDQCGFNYSPYSTSALFLRPGG